jgi:hypothetical protein
MVKLVTAEYDKRELDKKETKKMKSLHEDILKRAKIRYRNNNRRMYRKTTVRLPYW